MIHDPRWLTIRTGLISVLVFLTVLTKCSLYKGEHIKAIKFASSPYFLASLCFKFRDYNSHSEIKVKIIIIIVCLHQSSRLGYIDIPSRLTNQKTNSNEIFCFYFPMQDRE